MSDARTLAELSEESGIAARTIRFYIARGLLEGPVKAGRGAVYTAAHLGRLEEIKRLQGQGCVLAEIGRILNGPPPAETAEAPSSWWQHAIGDDVMVWVRADASPWRIKQIRAAIDEMASRVGAPKGRKGRSNHK